MSSTLRTDGVALATTNMIFSADPNVPSIMRIATYRKIRILTSSRFICGEPLLFQVSLPGVTHELGAFLANVN